MAAQTIEGTLGQLVVVLQRGAGKHVGELDEATSSAVKSVADAIRGEIKQQIRQSRAGE